ncbi:LAMI_0H17700g1_1 [Lachancea mirantina]|uniref:LAMI_0H17700g1_1 n=1 Tax=Lachancea mirantina TaxID=1230905 RepID=A0A1G4KJA6_9SACH|nr:LAMI_0H17700g1_1 [Lachancea mirantina]
MTIDHGGEGTHDGEAFASERLFQSYMMPSLKLFDTRVSINHWQLRNCIKHSSRHPGKLYYIFDHSIRVLDTRPSISAPSKTIYQKGREKVSRGRRSSVPNRPKGEEQHTPSHKVVELDFKSRCFDEKNGLIASGGLMGPDDNGSLGESRHVVTLSDLTESDSNSQSQNVEPIRIADPSILNEHSSYSNEASWKGTLSLYNEDTNRCLTYRLGQYINNCVTMYQRSNQQYDLFACNNDAHLYQCDISNRGVQLTKRYSDLKFPLNNACISHDGQTLITSGDSSKFAVYQHNEATGFFSLQYDTQPEWGSSVVRMKRIPRYAMPDSSGFVDHIYEASGGDHGFHTSFSENDLLFATVFQNGTCFLYDIRKMDAPLTQISSTRKHAQNGAFRVCKFSRGLDDLLFISEHQGRVHVVDTRNFSNHQVIIVPDRITTSTDQNFPLNARRSSLPAQFSNRFVTSATQIPVSEMAPILLPFPKAVNCISNNFMEPLYPRETQEGDNLRQPFRVRRVSTSQPSAFACLDSIDPTILEARYSEQNYRAVDNYNYLSSTLRRENTSNSSSLSFNDSETDDSSSEVVHESAEAYARPRNHVFEPVLAQQGVLASRQGEFSSPLETDALYPMEENHISGIDWMDDAEGSALVVGTGYGIMKWNINSWARRSFSSYDFC